MTIFKYNPITPGTRQRAVTKYDYLHKDGPEKSLVGKKKSISGRNNQGVITIFHRGGRPKKYREIDFKRDKEGILGKVARIEKDPNRTAHIALVNYMDGEKRYIIAQDGLRVGDEITSGRTENIKEGVSMSLKDFPLGSEISCVELFPGKGAQIARGAGTSCKLMSKDDKYAILKLRSGQMRRFLLECKAVFGRVSNQDHFNISYGKAGVKRWLGIRPTVRGVAMNPIDHPHGGGEGRTSGGRHPTTPWGKPTKGYKTRDKKKWSNKFIVGKGKVN